MVKLCSNDGKSECIFTLRGNKKIVVVAEKGSALFQQLSESEHWHKRWRNV